MEDIFQKIYSPKVLKHMKNPKNMGKIADANAQSLVGNPHCGDVMKLYLKIIKNGGQEYIKDIKFQTLGCGAAIATSSMITTLVKGKRLDEAEKVTEKAIAEALGGLPPIKFHCSVLSAEALKKAIADYRSGK